MNKMYDYGIVVGMCICFGVVLGVNIENVGVGITIGIIVGAAMGFILTKNRRR